MKTSSFYLQHQSYVLAFTLQWLQTKLRAGTAAEHLISSHFHHVQSACGGHLAASHRCSSHQDVTFWLLPTGYGIYSMWGAHLLPKIKSHSPFCTIIQWYEMKYIQYGILFNLIGSEYISPLVIMLVKICCTMLYEISKFKP